MLKTIINNLFNWCGNLLDAALTSMLKMFSFNLEYYNSIFPVAKTLYAILQGIALGLILGICAYQMIKCFTAGYNKLEETPMQLLFRTVIAIFAVFWGNYFLQLIINIASYPFNSILNTDAVDMKFTGFSEGGNGIISALAGVPGLLLALILILMTGWNVFKLMLEAVERYIMISVVVYTSPLAYATLSSKTTSTIFAKWVNMFISQCLMMLITAWSVKMLVSLFGATSLGAFYKFLYIIAFCKIAQKLDSYMQQLGLNPATTGGNLMDDILAVGHTLAAGPKAVGSAMTGFGTTTGNKDLMSMGRAMQQGGIIGTASLGIGKVFSGHGQEVAQKAAEAAAVADKQRDAATFMGGANKIGNMVNNSFNSDGTVKTGAGSMFAEGADGRPTLRDDIGMFAKPEEVAQAMSEASKAGMNVDSVLASDTIKNNKDIAGMMFHTRNGLGQDDAATKAAVASALFGSANTDWKNNRVKGHEVPYSGLDNKDKLNAVMPGFSDAVDNGNVNYREFQDGIMQGEYATGNMIVDENGNQYEEMAGFSIMTGDAYNNLTEEEQAGFTAVTGADGENYYAAQTGIINENIKSGDVQETTSTLDESTFSNNEVVEGSSETVNATVGSANVLDNSKIDDGNYNASIDISNGDVSLSQQEYEALPTEAQAAFDTVSGADGHVSYAPNANISNEQYDSLPQNFKDNYTKNANGGYSINSSSGQTSMNVDNQQPVVNRPTSSGPATSRPTSSGTQTNSSSVTTHPKTTSTPIYKPNNSTGNNNPSNRNNPRNSGRDRRN